MLKIVDVLVKDIRFPTSALLDGSDAMNPDPDYSATYVTLETNSSHCGNGLTFTIGRGNELCVAAVNSMKYMLINRDIDEITQNMGQFWRSIVSDSQLRWVGPEKGVIHLATAAIVNAVWDLYAKVEGKPLWKLLVDMSPEELVRSIDFRYITDVMTPQDALKILESNFSTRNERESEMLSQGYPAYTTSAGWLGYSDQKIEDLCIESVNKGWTHFKMKVGDNIDDDIRRASIMRNAIGPECRLMFDANQNWDVEEAIENMKSLAKFDPLWIEEPTSPDDVLGHQRISNEISPIGVATGEHCQNRIIFKQFFQTAGLQFCQLDSCRLGGVNEVLSVLLMAAKFNIPVCPHAGGVGLCEYVQHISIFDYICVSASLENRILEYVDHLHEHFEHPVVIKNGRYITPQKPGYSITMKGGSLKEYEFPGGNAWRHKNF